MSQEQIKLSNTIVSWVFKAAGTALLGMSLMVFNDMKEDVKSLKTDVQNVRALNDDVKIIKADVSNVRERVARIEGQLQK